MMEFTDAQRQAVETLDKNISVSAGAGAGKTRVLVERYIYILSTQSLGCENILAVTFTNKAAAEMKERIRKRLVEKADKAETIDGQLRWRRLQTALETAPISTIHGLCTRLLRENPVEGGIDPNFAVADGIQEKLLLAEAFESALGKALADNEDWFCRLMLRRGKKGLRSDCVQIYDEIAQDILLDGDFWGKQTALNLPDPNAAQAAREVIVEGIEQLADLHPSMNKTNKHTKATAVLVEHKAEVLASLSQYPFNEAARRCLETYLFPAIASSEKALDGAIVESMKEQKNLLAGQLFQMQAGEHLGDLLKMLKLMDAEFTRIKSARGVLTFDDLEARTLTLLREHQAVRDKYNQRYQYIMVDEFQDTNEMQRDLVYLLTGGAPYELTRAKLFIVGDPKQSIYRFRGADVSVFDSVTQDIVQSQGEPIKLQKNFRSAGHILEVMNQSFPSLMGTEEDRVDFQPLEPHFGNHIAQGCVELLTYPDGHAEERRCAEAEVLAGRIRAMVDDREQLVRDGQEARPVQFGDIAILMGVFSNLNIYEAAMRRAGIPYYVVGSRGFFQQQEIEDILNLLRVIDNRYNEKALAGVLRSPFFLMNDESLLWLKEDRRNLWESLISVDSNSRLQEKQKQIAVSAREVLVDLRRQRGHKKTTDLVEEAIRRTGFGNILLTQFMGLQKFANVQKLIGLARDFQANCYHSVGDFLRYADSLAQDEKSEGNAQIESESGDTVKIVTVHKSKGLEYPVVFLPDLGRDLTKKSGGFLYRTGRGLGVRIELEKGISVNSPIYDVLLEEEKTDQRLEAKRLLYVAMTRAESYLVLPVAKIDNPCGEMAPAKAKSYQDWIGFCFGIDNFATLDDRLPIGEIGITVRCGKAAPADNRRPWGEALLSSVDDVLPLPVPLAQQLAVIEAESEDPIAQFSATSLQQFRHCPRAFYYRYVQGLPELNTRSDGTGSGSEAPANIVGTVVHRFCETYKPGASLAECLEQAVWEVATAEWRDKVRTASLPLAKRYLASRLFQEFTTSALVKHEVPFEFCLAEQGEQPFWFYGKIDCLLGGADGLVRIVDFKTDRVDATGIPAKCEEYRWQAVLYASAVKACWNWPVHDFRLHFIRPDLTEAVDISPDTIRRTKTEMIDVCRFVRKHREEHEYSCDTSACQFCGYQGVCSRK